MDAVRNDTPQIYVLYTGGTFGMAPEGKPNGTARAGPLKPLVLEQLEAALPPAADAVPGLQVTIESLDRPLDSSSIHPADWLTIANKIKQNYTSFDGFVVIHGTDTLAYTAAALSFIFENLAKPVVITGSQLPLLSRKTDAVKNYQLALQAAAYPALNGQPIADVIVAFGGKILRGNRCRKMSASRTAAFSSPNCKPLGASMRGRLSMNNDVVQRPVAGGGQFQVNSDLETGVIDIGLFPGITPNFITRVLDDDRLRGVVIRTFGAGNAPETQEFLAALKEGLNKQGLIAIAVSHCPHGAVQPGRYAASTWLSLCDVIPGGDMTPEAALTKLMVFLPRIKHDNDKKLLQTNMRGEISHSD